MTRQFGTYGRYENSIIPIFLLLMETKQKNQYMLGLKNILGYDEMVIVELAGLSSVMEEFI